MCTYVRNYIFMYVYDFVHPAVNIIAPPEDTTVCKDSDVTINCRYQSAMTFPTKWLINGTLFTQQNLRDSPLYQLNNPFIPRSYSLTVFSITATTTFQCIVQSNPSSTSTLGTVTVIGMYAYAYMFVHIHTHA